MNKNTLINFLILVAACSLYRLIPDRMLGFAPQIAMAIFAGSVIKDKKWSFLMPLLSMLISDVIYEALYRNGLSDIKGFYEGQLFNYILFTGLTVIGFFVKENKAASILAGSVAGVLGFYLLSNFGTWVNGLNIAGNQYPKTWNGLVTCYTVAIPFLKGSLLATILFNGLFFGSHYLITKFKSKTAIA